MDSREMYKATSHLIPLVTWDNDWIHFGTDNQIKFELIQKLIEEHLPDKEILLIHGRTTSGQLKKEEIRESIKPLLGKDDFQLWTTPMDKVIQFNRIGVLNIGKKN